jgi:hypothetical protein
MSTVGAFSVVKHGLGLQLMRLRMTLTVLSLSTIFGLALHAAQNPAEAPSRPSVIDPRAQALIDKSIQALGGAPFLSFKRLTTTGRGFVIEDEETVGLAPFQSAVEYPDKRHFSYGKKQPVILINNGDQGWELDRYGRTPQKREQLHRWQLSSRYSLENLLRLRIHEPGMLIQGAGTDFVEQLPAHVISMVDAHQIELKLFINKLTFLPVRITYRVRNPEGDDWDEYSDVYGDYQKMQNVQTPMHITRFINGERVSETYRNSAKYDESYPPSYFQPPA